MTFFAVMQKNDELMAVHSQADFDYMVMRGWRRKEELKSETPQAKPKGKPGRKPKNPKQG
jgi:hypothetical protein